MKSSIFDYFSHFEYLKDRLDPKINKHGVKTKFSNHLRIQSSFLSQVLSEKYPLSLEQADLANEFFEHAQDESHFFILLVSRDRAGTTSLKKHFDDQITEVLKKRQLVIERLGKKTTISDEVKGVYYSSWIYPAIHFGSTLPATETKSQLAEKLGLTPESVGRVLDFLIENNLLKKEGFKYSSTDNWIRLDKNSPHIVKHHTNWRLRAIQNFEVQRTEDLHYSGLFTMSLQTAKTIKDKLLDDLKLHIAEIEKSPEEELFVLNTDFFRLFKSDDQE